MARADAARSVIACRHGCRGSGSSIRGEDPVRQGVPQRVDAAVQVIDRDGLAQVCRCNVGEELDVEAMSLYRHLAGKVVAVGASIRDMAPGDEVCGMTGVKPGAHAEYVAVPAKKLAR
ncbi:MULTISPECIES: alcohol dehydrogenase catalytic domain-containing protein [Streptomyces]|uniref:alcohol dehydrogenase catalytic domain-containing protein n=1 Tax=Streptomyces TaxID=1883 RepID=UPI001CC260BE|nr:hypothetical protein [Streptomyces venezuelae]